LSALSHRATENCFMLLKQRGDAMSLIEKSQGMETAEKSV
jgi:hypothetical protein